MPLENNLFVDIHCHVLPGIDDGPCCSDMSLAMLESAKASGIVRIVATPHYISWKYDNTGGKVAESAYGLRKASIEKNSRIFKDISLYSGCEALINPCIPELLKKGEVLTLAGTSFVLVELPVAFLPPQAWNFFYGLEIAGFRPVLAHPEKYEYLFKDEESISLLINRGVLFQINSSSIIGINGRKTQKAALDLIGRGACHFVASDSHSARTRSFATMLKAYDFLCGIYNTDEVAGLFSSNGGLLLENKEPERLCPKKKKSVWHFNKMISKKLSKTAELI